MVAHVTYVKQTVEQGDTLGSASGCRRTYSAISASYFCCNLRAMSSSDSLWRWAGGRAGGGPSWGWEADAKGRGWLGPGAAPAPVARGRQRETHAALLRDAWSTCPCGQ